MTELQNRFSAPANRVFSLVQSEVKRLQHTRIEPEHIMLVLLREKAGVAYLALSEMDIDLGELEKYLIQSLTEIEFPEAELSMSDETKRILGLSMDAVATLERPYLGTEHLLIALMRDLSNRVYPIMRQIGVTYTELLKTIQIQPHETIGDPENDQLSPAVVPILGEPLSGWGIFKRISPVFWLLLSGMLASGLAAYHGWFQPGIAVFLFVTLGWVVSVCLHEFGHALVAYWGGDLGVLERGYLTLNPLKYTHGVLSIVLPVLFLALGGIGLPGGAVYINQAALKSRQIRSSLSAAGPMVTGTLTLVLAFPFTSDWYVDTVNLHQSFWAGLSFLVFVQVWALMLNLMPFPGLDGFGVISPYLPAKVARQLNRFGSATLFIFIMLFVFDTPVQRIFWQAIGGVLRLLGVSNQLLSLGFELYRFW
ncbi:MAG: Clp protease N-terminal domain-containing protein [Chloroflexota bacterium]